MAIETSDKSEQTSLEIESREEKLEHLFQINIEIRDLESALETEKKASQGRVADLNGKIKLKSKEREDLLFKLNNRQETLIAVATTAEAGEPEEGGEPSDEDLAAYDEPEEGDGDGTILIAFRPCRVCGGSTLTRNLGEETTVCSKCAQEEGEKPASILEVIENMFGTDETEPQEGGGTQLGESVADAQEAENSSASTTDSESAEPATEPAKPKRRGRYNTPGLIDPSTGKPYPAPGEDEVPF